MYHCITQRITIKTNKRKVKEKNAHILGHLFSSVWCWSIYIRNYVLHALCQCPKINWTVQFIYFILIHLVFVIYLLLFFSLCSTYTYFLNEQMCECVADNAPVDLSMEKYHLTLSYNYIRIEFTFDKLCTVPLTSCVRAMRLHWIDHKQT